MGTNHELRCEDVQVVQIVQTFLCSMYMFWIVYFVEHVLSCSVVMSITTEYYWK